NVSRYNASGTTHNNGMGATLLLRLADTVTSKPEALADSSSHNIMRPQVGADSPACALASPADGCVLATTAGSSLLRLAVPRHMAANNTNSTLQPIASALEVNAGSSANGKLSSASSEPALDSANSQ